VDVLILRDVAEFCDYFRRDDHVTGGEQVLERVGNIGTDGCIRTGTARLTSAHSCRRRLFAVVDRSSIVVDRGVDRRHIPIVDVDVIGGSEIEWFVPRDLL